MLKMFLISLMIPIGCFSKTICQDTILTNQDLKKLNLILLQHNKWESETPLLNQQIYNYKDLCKSYEVSDSLHKESVKIYQNIIEEKSKDIKRLHKSNKIFKNISIGTSIITILCLILL